MDIAPFGPDDVGELDAWVELVNAIAAQDAPWTRFQTRARAAARFRHGWDDEPASPYLVRLDGDVVAWGSVSTSERDNLHLAWFELGVRPERRREGIGSAVLASLEDEARRRGRTSVGGEAWESDAARGFAEVHGYEPRLAAINRRQHLGDVDWPALERKYAAALPHAAGYVLERWPVPTPEDQLGALAQMASAINDAPTDDLDYEDEVFTADRMRAYEEATAAHGDRLHRIVARHVQSGDLAAQTVVAVAADLPSWGAQHDTSVVRAHRGHRLGLLVKTEMLRWLREAEPELEIVDTWNAESNDHMIGVNEVLGYRVMGREWAYQRSL